MADTIKLACDNCNTVLDFDDEIAFCPICHKYINMDSAHWCEATGYDDYAEGHRDQDLSCFV